MERRIQRHLTYLDAIYSTQWAQNGSARSELFEEELEKEVDQIVS
jgi:hypothetical protein